MAVRISTEVYLYREYLGDLGSLGALGEAWTGRERVFWILRFALNDERECFCHRDTHTPVMREEPWRRRIQF